MNTMQQEFDAVVEHLYKQGKVSQSPEGVCVYRNREGLKCAVGCRIPDEIYNTGMEGLQIGPLTDTYPNLPSELYEYNDMFHDLQRVHDTCLTSAEDGVSFNLSVLRENLETVARNFNLTFQEPPHVTF